MIVTIRGLLDSVEVPKDDPNSKLVFGSLLQREDGRKTVVESFYAEKELLGKLQHAAGKNVALLANVYKNKKGNLACRVSGIEQVA